MTAWWDYDAWPSRQGQGWWDGQRHEVEDETDFHLDLGCGRLPKARIGVDRYAAPGVAVVADLDAGETYAVPSLAGEDAPESALIVGPQLRNVAADHGGRILPFPDSSIKSIISHHALEHIGNGFMPLMDELYRVMEPGGLLRAITPLFPSFAAVADPDHKRYFLSGTWESFCGTPDNCWLDSFSVPYTKSRFEMVDKDFTARDPDPATWWMPDDAREIRVSLVAQK